MAFFTWKDEFSIGIDDIDIQHRTFLGYLNEGYDAVTLGNPTDISQELIDKLKAYAKDHFSFEENIMQLSGFPEFEKHQALHRDFENQILQLESFTGKSGSSVNPKYILTMMRDWFLNHILEEDKRLVPHV
jgi:hemerythrin-like metal-binding protein